MPSDGRRLYLICVSARSYRSWSKDESFKAIVSLTDTARQRVYQGVDNTLIDL